MTFLSVIGCVFLALQLLAIRDFAYARYELAHLLTLASALLLLWMGLMYWSALTRAAEGRALFPLIAVVSPLLAVGFVEIVWWVVFSLRPPNLEFVRAGDAVPKELLHSAMLWQLRFLALVTLIVPFTVIAGQYDAPQPIEALPPDAQPLYAEFGDVALIAYQRVDRRYSAGDQARLTLYWQVLRQSDFDNSIVLTLVDDHWQEIGRYTTYPGAGSLRTTQWRAGGIYPDEYVIGISGAAYGRYPFDLRIEWKDGRDSTAVRATDAEGAVIDPVLLEIGAVVTARYQQAVTGFSEIPPDSQPLFDESIRLEAFKPDLELNEISLTWKADSTPADNFTVFAHLLDADGKLLGQDDKNPRLPTKYWRWGEAFTTFHRFDPQYNLLDYQVVVGLYLHDGLTFPRLEYLKTIEATEDEEETEVAFDSFTIPWEIAAEVIELTATASRQTRIRRLIPPRRRTRMKQALPPSLKILAEQARYRRAARLDCLARPRFQDWQFARRAFLSPTCIRRPSASSRLRLAPKVPRSEDGRRRTSAAHARSAHPVAQGADPRRRVGRCTGSQRRLAGRAAAIPGTPGPPPSRKRSSEFHWRSAPVQAHEASRQTRTGPPAKRTARNPRRRASLER